MKTTQKKTGFTIVEMLMALVILAMLMTAVAVAFDASVTNFQVNEGISKTMNTARAALLRITTELRTAQGVAVIGTGGDPDNSQCSLIASDGRNITYRYSADEKILYLDDNTSGNSYALCRNVNSVTFNRALVPASSPAAVRNVRILLSVEDDLGKVNQTLAAAAVVRRNLN
ncbi:MAG: type II secretion system protein [Sedimentisphaerales bacterium]|nr:type II secretion system protein [Sedimentisphaerales bacterium]